MNKRNPCDVCENRDICSDTECVLSGYATKYQCNNYDCFLEYEDSCLLVQRFQNSCANNLSMIE
ncbi:MAG: hypothetical protein LUH14_01120, partial [Clostridiaceae bacterium]|nr:hypothetical protein [Clostridiaceae bacterium]